jgi:predicted NUDIX family NTP pyrophosphohydrolase
MAAKLSAGLLLFRRKGGAVEVLLVHPGGPYFKSKDEGAWSIPKGEPSEGEELPDTARREFREEIGCEVSHDLIPLGEVKQKGGKTVHAWAFEGDRADDAPLPGNRFEMEWPPRSGRRQTFSEIDRAEFFSLPSARRKINAAQVAFLDRLEALLAR